MASLFDGKPWEILEQFKWILNSAAADGGPSAAGAPPADGDNVVAMSYTIALGPLVWGLIVGALHAVLSYNGPSELVSCLCHRLAFCSCAIG